MPSAFHRDCSQRAWSTGWAGLNLICTLVGVMWVGLNWCLSMTETDLAWQVFAPECSPICISKSCWWKASAGPSVTATFGSNMMEYCKKSTMYAVCIYMVCVPMYKTVKVLPHLGAEADAAKLLCCHQAHQPRAASSIPFCTVLLLPCSISVSSGYFSVPQP